LNHRHCDFQSHALPTELPGPCAVRARAYRKNCRFCPASALGGPPSPDARGARPWK